jgi:hypothetical protein
VSIGADVVTLAALALTQVTGSSVPQGVASVLIGLALIGIGLWLVRRNHDFLVGAWVTAAGEERNRDIAGFNQPSRPALGDRARVFLLAYPGVTGIGEILTTFVGPGQVWIVARFDIDDGLTGAQVGSVVRGIEEGVKQLEYIYRVDVVPISGTKAVGT